MSYIIIDEVADFGEPDLEQYKRIVSLGDTGRIFDNTNKMWWSFMSTPRPTPIEPTPIETEDDGWYTVYPKLPC